VTEGEDSGIKHASLFDGQRVVNTFDFETQQPSPVPPVGQWFFLPSNAGHYVLAWYICPKTEDPSQHLFGLASAQELSQSVNRNTVHALPQYLTVRALAGALPLTEHAPYNDPAYRYEAVQRVIRADRESLSGASRVDLENLRERQTAQRAARLSDDLRRRKTILDTEPDDLADELLGLGMAPPSAPVPGMNGLYVAHQPRVFRTARRQFGKPGAFDTMSE